MTTIQRQLPFGPEKLVPFTEGLFDREEEKAARTLWSILENRSPRKSDWSQVFSESSEGANYLTIDRVLPELEVGNTLMSLNEKSHLSLLMRNGVSFLFRSTRHQTKTYRVPTMGHKRR